MKYIVSSLNGDRRIYTNGTQLYKSIRTLLDEGFESVIVDLATPDRSADNQPVPGSEQLSISPSGGIGWNTRKNVSIPHYSVGDYVKIIKNAQGHCFLVGEVVRIVYIDADNVRYRVRNAEHYSGFVQENDIQQTADKN